MSNRIPQITHHKASGQAVVRLHGKDFYLGPWGTMVAKSEYDRIMAEWLARGRPREPTRADGVTVAEVIAAFWQHAQVYYRHPDGTPTSELGNFRDALRLLRRLYGHSEALRFGPLALKAVRESMIQNAICRTSINRRISRIKHVFKWAAESEIISANIYHALQTVGGLKAGRTEARESAPVRAVPELLVAAVLPFLSRQVAAMVLLQQITGMRSGEVIPMRGVDIEMADHTWVYRPVKHKSRHLGHERLIFLGPRAQKIIKPFLKVDLNAHLFSPAEAETERRQELHSVRKTPLSCGHRPGTNVKRNPKKRPGLSYTVPSYAKAISKACDAAYPLPKELGPHVLENGKRETSRAWLARLTPAEREEIKAWRKAHHWHPHQLRHAAATNLRKTHGLEPAQVILGHKTLTVTQVYAEKNVEAAMRIMSEVG